MHSVLRKEWSKATGGGGWPPCDRCGYGDGNELFDFGPGDTYEVVFVDPDELDDADEYCPECDRRIEINIRFDDAEDSERRR